MKSIKFLFVGIILAGVLLSACAPAVPSAPASEGGGQGLSSEVVFTGVIESMDGDQWTIDGRDVRVDPTAIRDGSFLVGDTVKVEAVVAADGSINVQRVESPAAADLVNLATGTPDASSTSVPGSSGFQGLVFDNSGTEATGTVESITDTSITIGGQTFTFASNVEIKDVIVPGALVKLHFVTNADGTLSVTEIAFADPTQIGDDNTNGNNSNNNSNDNNANDDNGNDDNSNDYSDDDNSNDDDGNDDNSNDSNNNG